MADKKAAKPLVSIVILNWNGLEDTKICLEYVQKLDYPNYEVIVVDNGSSPEEKAYLSKLSDIVYIDNPKNRGFAGGQADGYRRATGEFILLLNNDAVIKSDYLKEAMSLFDDPEVAVVGGRSYFWNEDEPLLDERNRFYAYMNIDPVTAETTLLMQDHGSIQEVNVVSGSAVLVRRSTIEEVGYLWEPFFAYYEETDLFARMKRAGYKVLYNPKLRIWHKNGASSGAQEGSFFFYYHIFRNRYIFAARNFDDEHFERFKKSYYRLARQSITAASSGPAQRRLAKAYVKAIASVRRQRAVIADDRKKLKEQLPGSYSRKIIQEQLSISAVIDASSVSEDKLSKLYEKLSQDTNPMHEYVIVTNATHIPKESARNVRFVLNKGFFDVHPVNIGCLAAQYDWLVITDASSLPDIDSCIEKAVDNHTLQPSAITLSGSSIMMTKQLFECMGGLQESAVSLQKNITAVQQYARAVGKLVGTKPPILSNKQQKKLAARIELDGSLSSLQHNTSRWQKLLQRYYRLQQMNNLALWTLHPSITLRTKLGRTKNIALSGITLNRKQLATELKHVRNEVIRESMQAKTSEMTVSLQKKINGFSDKQLVDTKNIPVFIICYERVNDLSKLVKKIEKMGLKKIVLIDNDSTYQPLLDYYQKTPYQVLSLRRNAGHTAPWNLAIVRTLIPYGYYIVTDPDVLPTDACVNSSPIQHLIKIHKKYPAHQKVGFGLKIDDLPSHYPLRKEVIKWEGQFWRTELGSGVYEAGVDTTFALYKPGTYIYTLHPSLRTGEPYTARHMPWYTNPDQLSDEDRYYKMRASSTITSWNVDELPERYKKEMGNVKK